MAKINLIAADIHRHMAEHAAHGYTQGAGRWGGDKKEVLFIRGGKYWIGLGDYDCSSSSITAWREALKGTAYEGKLDKATFTGNLKSVFVASGLFEVWPISHKGSAHIGDLFFYHKVNKDGSYSGHVGIYQGNGMISEALGNERGGVTGGKTGDNNGREFVVRHVGDFKGFTHILHYNRKADPVTPPAEKHVGDKYSILSSALHVRKGSDKASMAVSQSGKLVTLKKGEAVYIDGVYTQHWGRISEGKYKGCYICLDYNGTEHAKKC